MKTLIYIAKRSKKALCNNYCPGIFSDRNIILRLYKVKEQTLCHYRPFCPFYDRGELEHPFRKSFYFL